MGFWDKALGTPAPQQQAPLDAFNSTRPWFEPDLPQPVHQPSQQQAPQVPSKALSARSTMTCPNCASGNIFKPGPSQMEQCYECGWNPRFTHTTAGAGLPSDSATPATPSRQVSTANNYNPQTVIASVK